MIDYLDLSAEELRRDEKLTSLSVCFYAPPPSMGTRELAAAAAAGRRIWMLSAYEQPLEDPIDLGWNGLQLGRWTPPPPRR